MAGTSKPKPTRSQSQSQSQSHTPSKSHRAQASNRSSSSAQKTLILINVYDLLPPGTLSSALWFIGSSLLHTGVVIKTLNREYAFGGHDRPLKSGVYWTNPRTEPPGGTFRCELVQGFTFRPADEIERIVREASLEFQGTSYNLLSNNCNHFTNHLCQKLTGKCAPGWLNRAASIGIALPCVVPREWIAPPDHDTADGELIIGEEEDDEDERTSMLRQQYHRGSSFKGGAVVGTGDDGDAEEEEEGWDSDWDRRKGGSGKGKGKGKCAVRDTDDRVMPVSERAPPPKQRR